jgi:hypothetical protein
MFSNVLLEKDGEISWTDSVRNGELPHRVKKRGISYIQHKERRQSGLATSTF